MKIADLDTSGRKSDIGIRYSIWNTQFNEIKFEKKISKLEHRPEKKNQQKGTKNEKLKKVKKK